MLRRPIVRLVASASSVPVISTEGLIKIIGQSDKIPVEKITDHFDKNMKQIFASDSDTIARSVIQLDGVDKLQVPTKVREHILAAVLKNFDSLNREEILSVPRLLKRLPQTMVVSETEDALFERFLSCVGAELLAGEALNVVKAVAQLHFKHPCKEEPVVRLFEALAMEPLSGSSRLDLLTAAGSVLGKQKLAHPVVRKACIDLLAGVENQCLGRVLLVSAELPVFPDKADVLPGMCVKNAFPNTTSGLVSGLVGVVSMTSWPVLEKDVVPDLIKGVKASPEATDAFLTEFSRVRHFNAAVARLIAMSVDPASVGSAGGIAGYLRLLALTESPVLENEIERLVPTFPAGGDMHAIACVMSSAATATESLKESFWKQHVLPGLAKAGPGVFHVLLSGQDAWLVERLAKSVAQNQNPESLALVLVKTDAEPVGDRLRTVLKTGVDIRTLTRVWKILAEDGLVYADPSVLAKPRGRLLKETTASVFRSVRMAPVPRS